MRVQNTRCTLFTHDDEQNPLKNEALRVRNGSVHIENEPRNLAPSIVLGRILESEEKEEDEIEPEIEISRAFLRLVQRVHVSTFLLTFWGGKNLHPLRKKGKIIFFDVLLYLLIHQTKMLPIIRNVINLTHISNCDHLFFYVHEALAMVSSTNFQNLYFNINLCIGFEL